MPTKRFTVRPSAAGSRKVVLGGSGSKELAFLGRLAEVGQPVEVHFDAAPPHVIAIFGKRGSGKSYSLGAFLESMASGAADARISSVEPTRGILLFDTLGIFQWMDLPLTDDTPTTADQLRQLRGWPVQPTELRTTIWVPAGTTTVATENVKKFSVNISDLAAEDWGYLLGLDVYQDRMGQLLNDLYLKTISEGWREAVRFHAPKLPYELGDLLLCLERDVDVQANYQAETRRAMRQQLVTLTRNPLFQPNGTDLKDLLTPGTLSVLVLNKLSDELRTVVIAALMRRILASRTEASEIEKTLKISSSLTSSRRAELEQRLSDLIPPCWIAADEAQNFLPAGRRTILGELLVKLVREGRNYGVSFLLTTQQPSAVDQRILSQVDTIVAHKLTVQTDVEYVKRNLKSSLPEVKYANASLDFDELLRLLDAGQALVSNTDSDRAYLVEIRPRVTVHGGF